MYFCLGVVVIVALVVGGIFYLIHMDYIRDFEDL